MGILDVLIADIGVTIVIVDAVLIIMMMFWERSDPRSVLVWAVVMLFLPLVGFVAYLVVGQTFYTKWSFKSKRVSDAHAVRALSRQLEAVRREMDADPRFCERLRFAGTLTGSGAGAYSNRNRVTLFTDGREKFDSLFEDLRNAKEHINFEYYIIRNDELADELMDILSERAAAGVEVRLMVDAIGSNSPKNRIREFKEAGGKYTLFHSTLTVLLSPRKNNRNHRKVAVIDGKVAYIGGFNVGTEYLGLGPLGYWRDSAVRIEGDCILHIQSKFLSDWRYATREDIVTEERFYRNIGPAPGGDDGVQMVSGGPDCADLNPIHIQYLNMITKAESTLYIHTPYLSLDPSLIDALRISAMSGTDVRIMIPGKPDHPFVFWNNRYNADLLMRCGVRVFQYRRGFVHSKTVVADGRYCSVGSANFDIRSMKLNFETNAMIYSERVGSMMKEAFETDLEDCVEYTREDYAGRTTVERFRTGVSRMFSGQV